MYAQANREEWEKKGESMVQAYLDRLNGMEPRRASSIELPPAPPTDTEVDTEIKAVGCVDNESNPPATPMDIEIETEINDGSEVSA